MLALSDWYRGAREGSNGSVSASIIVDDIPLCWT